MMLGDKLKEKCFRRRPGQGSAGVKLEPGLEITEVGGERAQGVVAHALLRQMFQRGDIVIGQQRRQLVTAVEGQDGIERIEFVSTAQHRIGGGGQGFGLRLDGIGCCDLAFPI